MSVAAHNPGTSLSMSELRRTVQMRERVVEACRLVELRRSVRGVHIVARGRPTSDELQRYQGFATSCHVALTVDAQERMRLGGRKNGIDGDGQIAAGAIFKADRG